MSRPTVSVGRPTRIASTTGGVLHGVVVTVRSATPAQVAEADALAASFAGTQRDAGAVARYRVRQAPPREGDGWALAGPADREAVIAKAARLAETLRRAFATKAGAR